MHNSGDSTAHEHHRTWSAICPVIGGVAAPSARAGHPLGLAAGGGVAHTAGAGSPTRMAATYGGPGPSTGDKKYGCNAIYATTVDVPTRRNHHCWCGAAGTHGSEMRQSRKCIAVPSISRVATPAAGSTWGVRCDGQRNGRRHGEARCDPGWGGKSGGTCGGHWMSGGRSSVSGCATSSI